MEVIQLFISDFTAILINILTYIGSGCVMIAPFIFWLIFNVVALFRLMLLASYKRGFN